MVGEEWDQVRRGQGGGGKAGRALSRMGGFNRRFAPLTEKTRQFFAGRREPMLIHARVNAGYIPHDHWLYAQGGRIIGEFCHFVDWARSVIGSPIESVAGTGLPASTQCSSD